MNSLSEENSNTAVIVDDVHLIHRLPFTCGETFQEVSDRFLQALILDITEGTSSIHFCCDRYDHLPSLNPMERARRKKPGSQKLYEIQPHLPAFRDFIPAHGSKVSLMCFLSGNWSSSIPHRTGDIYLYLTGGFPDGTKTMMVNDNRAKEISEFCVQC